MDNFVFEEILSSFTDKKLVILLGHMDGESEDKKAILKLEKQEWCNDHIFKKDNETIQKLNFTDAEKYFENDIFSTTPHNL